MHRVFDGMTWPAPCKEMNDLEWNLRYAPDTADTMLAASIVAAYREMVGLPRRARDRIISELRCGPNTGRYYRK